MRKPKPRCPVCGKSPVYAQKRCKRCYVAALKAGEISRIGSSNARPVKDRLLDKVRVDASGCWVFEGYINPGGYGAMLDDDGNTRTAHRISYKVFVGPIPDGLQLDHLCHTSASDCAGGPSCPHRRCVNPAHLEPVTQRENALRGVSFSAVNAVKTHCKSGHEFTPENTYYRTPTHRQCRTCIRAWVAAYKKRKAQS
ncbi:HNH endonuclease signature motif containing protein [Streptomyces chartreusis]|uniref:HNH endonuclease signature motif containing protein n=1 Tax=Streptomyces chartreusis TaxID=1969 RepID=UPI00382C560F